jgi:5-methylthioadenosine/S-adenosylhomocysteine deaminase
MSRIVIENGTFLSMVEGEPVFRGYLVMEADCIAYIGESAPEQLDDDVRIDGRGKLYMPGLVNTHGHAAMSLLRGVGDDLALQVWLEQKMWPLEAKFTATDVIVGSELSVLEMLKGGTTSFVDMYSFMDEVAHVVETSGIRGCLTRGVIGYCPPDEADAKLVEARAFAKEWHGRADGRITTMMAPHAPYTCPPDYIEKIVAIAEELQLPIHTHLSESRGEVERHEQQYGIRPVEHLRRLGVFNRPCIVAHGVHLNDEEIEICRAHDVRISHNPGSNLKLASGIARVPAYLHAGLLVSLGTDSAASNNNLDMFEEVRLAALIHKGVSGDPTAVPAFTALSMATSIGARSIWLADVGQLKVGMKADVIAINIDQPHFQPLTDLVSHIVYAASAQDVTDVFVDGKQVVRNRQCLTLDEERIKAEANQALLRLRSS